MELGAYNQGVLRQGLMGALMTVILSAAPGCTFDTSGHPFDASNTNTNTNQNDATNSNNANTNGNVNTNTNAGNNNNTPASVCGDGVAEAGEGCDDGNTAAGDGCDGLCQLELGWDCSVPPCVPVCGDGVVVGGEGCDDGDNVPGDGCASDCGVEPFQACVGEPSLCHCVIYVDQAGVPSPRTGATWMEGLATVAEGIAAASSGCDVWVADGVYYLWQGSDDDTIDLKSNVSVYGGFAGGETQRDQRNWVLNATVLNGANAAQTQRVFHVVSADAVQGAELNGFTVTGGNAKWGRHGGGIYVVNSNVVLGKLRVENNTADINGGGIHSWDSTVTLSRSRIESNDANDGGGVNAEHHTQMSVSRCRFVGNQADYHGGGLRVFDYATVTASNTLFVDNSVLYNYGGAIVNWSLTNLILTNCTIFRNQAPLSAGAIRNLSADSCIVRNSIIWGNSPNAFDDVVTAVSLTHTIMQDGGWAGSNGNLSDDPLLLPSQGPGQASPAIDTADDSVAPITGLGGNARVDVPNAGTPGTLADMGCFEYNP